MEKDELEHEINSFFSQAMGDAFKKVTILQSDVDEFSHHVDLPTEKYKSLEYGMLPIKIEMANGKSFTLTASEWAQVTID